LRDGLEAWLYEVDSASQSQAVVVLASGDPGFYGIAKRLIERLGSQSVCVWPNVTAMQAAFARLKLPWQEAKAVSLHGRNCQNLFSAVAHHDLVAVYTDPENSPGLIARLLLERGQSGWRMMVAENLGGPDERVRAYSLEEAAGIDFGALNLVVLQREERPAPLCMGMPEDDFEHTRGLITKTEVRAVALAKLRLSPRHLLWDLGAGCGSLGLEASRLLWQGGVLAVERGAERVAQIKANQARFGAANLKVIKGEMPSVLEGLPRPDRVFVGGAGPALAGVLRVAGEALPAGGVVVVAAVRLEAVQEARLLLADMGMQVELVQLQVSRGAPLGGDTYMRALNPVWLICGTKEAA
ncbi:precorrin-6y C5,15-methyltransferase (decarboxylating) subunit CbiE, partial [Patescibacteria group bacterium]|nr:precorrin-6y C5,15-methyltransferase (decarboxylating) subunit CbiE [Patescibacteria group bacterium]